MSGRLFLNLQVDDYSLVRFIPLDPTDDDCMSEVLLQIDMTIQYGEDLEPKEPRVGVTARSVTHNCWVIQGGCYCTLCDPQLLGHPGWVLLHAL